jgi:hypothetical protein
MGARSTKNTTQNNRSDGHLLEYFRNTFVRGGGGALPRTVATGGTVTEPGNGYKYHTFTSLGNFVVSGRGDVECLVVAGGGGAGAPLGSGGGAGGLVHHSSFAVTIGTYSIEVGGGGAGATGPGTPGVNTTGTKGGPSTFGGMTADGGGGGAPYYADGITGSSQVSGGSGGGFSTPAPGSATQPGLNAPFTPNPNFAQYGNNGSPAGDPIGGAGGGAGAAGPPTGVGGAGRQYPGFTGPLIGVPALNPLSGFFAGGGAAGRRQGPALSGGSGGGGPNPGSTNQGTAGTQNSGGGAGGGTYMSIGGGMPSAAGGSGIVIIRYLV